MGNLHRAAQNALDLLTAKSTLAIIALTYKLSSKIFNVSIFTQFYNLILKKGEASYLTVVGLPSPFASFSDNILTTLIIQRSVMSISPPNTFSEGILSP